MCETTGKGQSCPREGLNDLRCLHKTVVSIAHFSLNQMFRDLSEAAFLSFLLSFFFSVEEMETPAPALTFLVAVLLPYLPTTTRCPGKSQAGFTGLFPQTWHTTSLASHRPQPRGDWLSLAQRLGPQLSCGQFPFPLSPCHDGSACARLWHKKKSPPIAFDCINNDT